MVGGVEWDEGDKRVRKGVTWGKNLTGQSRKAGMLFILLVLVFSTS